MKLQITSWELEYLMHLLEAELTAESVDDSEDWKYTIGDLLERFKKQYKEERGHDWLVDSHHAIQEHLSSGPK